MADDGVDETKITAPSALIASALQEANRRTGFFIRPSLKRDLAFSVDDPNLTDAQFREAVRIALKSPLYE